jgi:hypothetical protein
MRDHDVIGRSAACLEVLHFDICSDEFVCGMSWIAALPTGR